MLWGSVVILEPCGFSWYTVKEMFEIPLASPKQYRCVWWGSSASSLFNFTSNHMKLINATNQMFILQSHHFSGLHVTFWITRTNNERMKGPCSLWGVRASASPLTVFSFVCWLELIVTQHHTGGGAAVAVRGFQLKQTLSLWSFPTALWSLLKHPNLSDNDV